MDKNKKCVGPSERKPRISKKDEEKIIEKYFGCPLKYIRKRGTSITIDVIGMAYDGVKLKQGTLEDG